MPQRNCISVGVTSTEATPSEIADPALTALKIDNLQSVVDCRLLFVLSPHVSSVRNCRPGRVKFLSSGVGSN